jgi:hypothetical protein
MTARFSTARRPGAQREGRSADRPGAHRPRGDLRDPRPDRATIPKRSSRRGGSHERQDTRRAKRETDRMLGEAREQKLRGRRRLRSKLAERQAQRSSRRPAARPRDAARMEDRADGILSTPEVNLDSSSAPCVMAASGSRSARRKPRPPSLRRSATTTSPSRPQDAGGTQLCPSRHAARPDARPDRALLSGPASPRNEHRTTPNERRPARVPRAGATLAR